MLTPRVREHAGVNHDYSIYRLKCFAVTELLIFRSPLGSPDTIIVLHVHQQMVQCQ